MLALMCKHYALPHNNMEICDKSSSFQDIFFFQINSWRRVQKTNDIVQLLSIVCINKRYIQVCFQRLGNTECIPRIARLT